MTPLSRNTINIAGFELSAGNLIAILVCFLSLAASWGAFQFQINAVQSQVNKRDQTDGMYLRADVQAARDETITVQLRSVLDRLDRVQKVLDERTEIEDRPRH